jgi:hypothetical protein
MEVSMMSKNIDPRFWPWLSAIGVSLFLWTIIIYSGVVLAKCQG